MAEVIAFLIEHFQNFDACPPPEGSRRLLEDAGFDATEAGNTLMMLGVLLNSSELAAEPLDSQSVRVHSSEETDNLLQEVMGLMQYLVSERAITYEQREIVIHTLMHIPPEEITVDTAKVLTLLVLQAYKSELLVLIGDGLVAALNGKVVMHQYFSNSLSLLRGRLKHRIQYIKREQTTAENPLIAESPSKARTLRKCFGGGFGILAPYNHVRSLIPKNGIVNPEHDFIAEYELIKRNAKHIDAIAARTKEAENIYFATDPDRESEAISWHLHGIPKTKRGLKNVKPQRVMFHETTKNAVLDAVANPCEIEMDLVDAQQARYASDYLVGFNFPPLLWKKIHRGLSADRMQSLALRLTCEHEDKVRMFEAQGHWTVYLNSHKDRNKFTAKPAQYNGAKLEQFDLPDEVTQADVLRELEGKEAVATAVEKKKRSRNPAAPFTTSTIQQDVVRKLGFTADRTIRTAQQLYENIDIGQGAIGLTTYIYTDSMGLADETLTEIHHYIGNKIGKGYLPNAVKQHKTKSKNAQEAHGAIRPTSVYRASRSIKSFLGVDQFKLHQMIWQCTITCRVTPAKFDQTTVDITVGKSVFRVTGQVQTSADFLSVCEESSDDGGGEDNKKLSEMSEGDKLPVDKLYGERHFITPSPCYNEATLVKALEEYGIGRPSIYASVVSTLKDRKYVTLEQRCFMPTDVGDVVNRFLTEHFAQHVDYHFIARLEDQLGEIADGECRWIPVMGRFWKPFIKQVEEEEGVGRTKFITQKLDEACPKCNEHKLQIKFGKMGRFVACAGCPECSHARNVNETVEEAAERIVRAGAEQAELNGRERPKCGGQPMYRCSRIGSKSIGRANYPKYGHVEPLEKPKDTGIQCPQRKRGNLVERKPHYGRLFYSCSTYPDCNYVTQNPPITEECPNCHWLVLTIKTIERRGVEKAYP